MKRTAALGGALLLLLVAAVPAAAANPEKRSDTYDFDPQYLYSCSEKFPGKPAFDFQVWGYGGQTTEADWWLKPGGDPSRVVARHSGTRSVYRADKPGVVLSGSFQYTSYMDVVSWDPLQYYEHSTGTYLDLRTSGGATVVHDAGYRWSALLGSREGWDRPDLFGDLRDSGLARYGEAICEALAG